MNKLKKGDFIKCHDKDDMVDTFTELMKYDIETILSMSETDKRDYGWR